MGEVLDGSSLPREALSITRGAAQVWVEDLDGDVATQRCVASPVDGRHAPFADLLEDLEFIDHSADHGQSPAFSERSAEAGQGLERSTVATWFTAGLLPRDPAPSLGRP